MSTLRRLLGRTSRRRRAASPNSAARSEMSAVSPPALAGSIVSSPSSTLAEAAAGGSGPSSASWMASRGRFRLTGLAGRSDGFRPLVAEPILEEESDYEAPEDSHSEPDAPSDSGPAAPSGDIGAARSRAMRPPGRQRTSVRGRLASGTTAVVSPSARSAAAGRRGDARGCRSTALANPCGGDRRLLAFGRAVDGPNSRSHNALATALGAISAASQLLMLVVLNAYLLILNYLSP
uniref:ORF3 n=1 Tax=Macrostomum lignano TaxID=282301 RepID=A0A1I8FSL8_9PLAT